MKDNKGLYITLVVIAVVFAGVIFGGKLLREEIAVGQTVSNDERPADEEEYNTRRRRNAFYSRNDVIMSDIMSEAAGVRYNIWYKPFTGDIPESDKLRNILSDLYNVMFKRCEDADITWNIF